MNRITCKTDLNRAVANLMCPEPPLSIIAPRMGWRWAYGHSRSIAAARGEPNGHWEPVDFCGDPIASYRLEQWVLQSRDLVAESHRGHWTVDCNQKGTRIGPSAYHESRLIALCLAVCGAHGMTLELAEGWDMQ